MIGRQRMVPISRLIEEAPAVGAPQWSAAIEPISDEKRAEILDLLAGIGQDERERLRRFYRGE